MTTVQLFAAFANGTTVIIKGIPVYIVAIERESGCGHCYNLKVRAASQTWWEFMRTL